MRSVRNRNTFANLDCNILEGPRLGKAPGTLEHSQIARIAPWRRRTWRRLRVIFSLDNERNEAMNPTSWASCHRCRHHGATPPKRPNYRHQQSRSFASSRQHRRRSPKLKNKTRLAAGELSPQGAAILARAAPPKRSLLGEEKATTFGPDSKS